MTTRRARPHRRSRPLLALVCALPVALSGCGLAADVAGVHDAPTEQGRGGAVTREAAQEIAARVLGEARTARGDGATAEDRRSVLMGPALREADAAARARSTASPSEAVQPQVLAVSEGTGWPRTIVATTRTDEEQRLYVLVSTSAEGAYRLFADVQMASGAAVPGLADPAQGSPVRINGTPGDAVETAVTGWSEAVAYPAPSTRPSGVSVADEFSTALRTNAEQQAEELDGLAEYTQEQQRQEATMVSIGLADGGRLAFVPMTRTDTLTAGEELQELTLEDAATRRLADTEAISQELTVEHAETLAVHVPSEGAARVVGASEQIESAEGS